MARATDRVVGPRSRPGARIPALDGLRAVAISLVLLGHLSGTRGFSDLHIERWIGDYANLGVTLFFVISGFLITRLLLEERLLTGSISLPRFYARRLVRLCPAFLVFVGCVAAADAFGYIRLRPGDLVAAVTYTVNFCRTTSWYVGHLWSLSVEEQFYAVWPVVLFAAGGPRAKWIAAAMLALSPAARLFALYYHFPGSMFPCVADSLAAGCLLALAGDVLLERSWYRRLLASWWWLPALLVVLSLANRSRVYVIGIGLGVCALNVSLALVVHYCVLVRSKISRMLQNPVLVYIGLLSYSLYLWQQLFVNRTSRLPISAFPLNLMLAVIAAHLSYYGVERPLNELRRRLHPSASPALWSSGKGKRDEQLFNTSYIPGIASTVGASAVRASCQPAAAPSLDD